MQSQFLHIKILDAINNGYMIRMSLIIYNYNSAQKIQLPQNTVGGLLGGVSRTSLGPFFFFSLTMSPDSCFVFCTVVVFFVSFSLFSLLFVFT